MKTSLFCHCNYLYTGFHIAGHDFVNHHLSMHRHYIDMLPLSNIANTMFINLSILVAQSRIGYSTPRTLPSIFDNSYCHAVQDMNQTPSGPLSPPPNKEPIVSLWRWPDFWPAVESPAHDQSRTTMNPQIHKFPNFGSNRITMYQFGPPSYNLWVLRPI